MFALVPIGSDRNVYGLPWFTIAMIGCCTMVYVASITGFNAIGEWGYRPASGVGANVVLSLFVHAGFLHLLGNMLFLWGMGVNLEARWGPGPFALLYFTGGIAASLTFAGFHASSNVPLVGASGAISTCMGAFLVSFFKSKVRILYWLLIRVGTFQIPAYVIVPFWFAGDLLGAWGEVRRGASGVAYSAHVGGFLMGVAVAGAMKVSGLEARLMDARGSDIWDEPEQWRDVPVQAPVAAEPWRCKICNLVNTPSTTVCRRCRAKL